MHPGELPLAAGKYLPEYGDPIGRWLAEPLMRLRRLVLDDRLRVIAVAGKF